MKNEIEIVATGEKWIGQGVRTTSSIINEIITSAKSSLLLTAYILSNRKILENIENALKNEVEVNIYLNNPEKSVFRIENYLKMLERDYDNLKVHKMYGELFHAKIIIADRKISLIGSANLTKPAMMDNYELGVLIRNADISFELENVVRRVLK